MKKFLAIIMTMAVVLTMLASVAVMADEPVVTNEQAEATEPAADPMADINMDILKYYYVFDFKDSENITFSQTVSCDDAENLKKIEEHIDEIVRLAASCNLSKQEIIEMVNFSLEEQ